MWADDVADSQLDDIYARLQKEKEYESKFAEDQDLRSDLPVLREPNSAYYTCVWEQVCSRRLFAVPVASPGRPSAITPLQPHRTPSSKKVSSNRYHGTPSPLHRKSVNRIPIFSRAPGPPKAPRLSRNSLLAGTQAVRNAIRHAATHAKMPDWEFEDPSESSTTAPAPMSLDGPLRMEEYEMQDLDFTRWVPATYQWRLDETWQFRDIFNHSELSKTRGIIFWIAPDVDLASVLQQNASTPATLDDCVCSLCLPTTAPLSLTLACYSFARTSRAGLQT